MQPNRSERHRLTTLQRQVLKWLKMEGGGVLAADRLFAALVKYHTIPDADAALLGQRLCEAVDNLVRKDYAEVRLETQVKTQKALSLYDFGPFGKNVQFKGGKWTWKKGECPMVALTDEGSRYVDLM